MGIEKPIIVIGLIIVVLGTIFHMQGQSMIGPESSFMYSNPEWITYGLQILIGGGIIVGAGIVLVIFKKFS